MVHDFIIDLHNKLYGKFISIGKQIGFIADHDRDLYHSAILLKNLAIVRKDYPVSLDYMLEELSRDAGSLTPIFQETLSVYRSGRYDEAFGFFAKAVRSRYGRSFASLMSKMDRINPYELVGQIDIFLGVIREVRMTASMKQAQRRSLVIMALAAASALCVLVNFCVVVVFLDTLENLRFIF